MRHPLRSLAVLALVLLGCAGPGLAELTVGQPAPDFRLRDLDGREHALAELRGRPVVLEWINPNCPFSRRHSREKTMQTTAAAHPDAVWLAISSTRPGHGDHLTPAQFKSFLAEHGVAYPVLEDPSGEVGRAYGAKTTPHMFVVDAEGRVAYVGAIDDDPRGRGAAVNYVAAGLDALAAGRRPEPASTPPYGCSVKY